MEEDQIQKLKNLDVCLIPVGGHFTIDGRQAAKLVRMIQPRLVIPMHYKDTSAGFGFNVISEVDIFTECMDSVLTLGDSSLSTELIPDAKVVVLTPRDK